MPSLAGGDPLTERERAAASAATAAALASDTDASNEHWLGQLTAAGLVEAGRYLEGFRFDPGDPADVAASRNALAARVRGCEAATIRTYSRVLLHGAYGVEPLAALLRRKGYPVCPTRADLADWERGLEHYRHLLSVASHSPGCCATFNAATHLLRRLNRLPGAPLLEQDLDRGVKRRATLDSDATAHASKRYARDTEVAEALTTEEVLRLADRYLSPQAPVNFEARLWVSTFLLMMLAGLRCSGLGWLDVFRSRCDDKLQRVRLYFCKRKCRPSPWPIELAYRAADLSRPYLCPRQLLRNIIALTGAGTTAARRYLVPQMRGTAVANRAKPCTGDMLRSRFRRYLEASGIARARLYPAPGRRRAALTPHSLRATLISWVRDLTKDDKTAARMAGCSEANLPRYTRLEAERCLAVSRAVWDHAPTLVPQHSAAP
jgi:hypothetical protein